MKKILLIICILNTFINAFAQKILTVGDSVPDLVIENVINYKSQNINLKGFSDKLLILDFGFTSCAGCIEKLPEMVALQNKYGQHFQFFWVTYESNKDVVNKFNGFFKKTLQGLTIPTITRDKQLHSLFPHTVEPHEIWILNGKVIGITSADKVNNENVGKIVLRKELPEWAIKKDIDYNARDSSLLKFSTSQISKTTKKYYSAVTGALPNSKYRQGGIKADSNANTKRIYNINSSMVELYIMTIHNLNFDLPFNKSILLEVKDRSIYDYRYRKNGSATYRDEWEQQYNHSYEAVAPISTPDEKLYDKMRQDLNYYFGLNGRKEERAAKTWVIKLLNNDSTQVMKQPKSDWYAKDQIYSGMKIKDMAFNLNDISAYETPIYVDESGYNGKININLKGVDLNNFDQVKAALNKQGLALVEGEGEFSFLVITEVGNNEKGK